MKTKEPITRLSEEKRLEEKYLGKVVKVRMVDQSFKSGKLDVIAVQQLRSGGELTVIFRFANIFWKYEHSIDYFERNTEILG